MHGNKVTSPARSVRSVRSAASGKGRESSFSKRWIGPILVGTALGAAVAMVVRARARQAEHAHPPAGRFLTVDGVRLHYREQGSGSPIVLFHGNGALIEDMFTSGLVAGLARDHRVITFDRPGFGYSERPRDRIWTPNAQAMLLSRALDGLGVGRVVAFGHSWGTLVAIALALQEPDRVSGLVLASGYYFPTARLDVPIASVPAIPIVGDALRYTVAPIASRLLLKRIYRKVFDPAPVPERFRRQFPHELVLRPSHLRAASADLALMIPVAAELENRYRELTMPVAIVAGGEDRIVSTARHSERLHRLLPASTLRVVPGEGHMVHYGGLDAVIDSFRDVERRFAPAPESFGESFGRNAASPSPGGQPPSN